MTFVASLVPLLCSKNIFKNNFRDVSLRAKVLHNKWGANLGFSGSQEFPQLIVDVTPHCLDDASAAHSK